MSKIHMGFLNSVIACGLVLICIFTGCASIDQYEIETLRESNKALQKELARIQAVDAIQKLMGRYETIHNPTDMYKTYMLFANRTDTRFNISGSSVTGYENIKKQFEEMTASANERGVEGTMYEHPLSTPIIEVAGDGHTAKGTWVSMGQETMGGSGSAPPGGSQGGPSTGTPSSPPRGASGQNLTAMWCYGKYAIDFIKVNGEWKIWHLQWVRIFRSPFDTSWVDQPIDEAYGQFYQNGKIIEKEGVYFKPYHTEKIFESIPAAPKPYETWTDKEEGWWLRETVDP